MNEQKCKVTFAANGNVEIATKNEKKEFSSVSALLVYCNEKKICPTIGDCETK